MASHTLTFSKLRANFTVDKELIGKQDPYILFQSGHTKVQTKAIKGVGTGTAEWKESYTLEKFSPSSSSTIEVTVYNHNTLLPDSIIGSGTVDLSRQGSDSLSGSGGPLSVVLTDKKGQEVGSLSFVTNGGGYTGRGASSGTGVGSGVGTGLGAGAVGAGHHGHSGSGHTGTVVGKGSGSDQRTAQAASDAAARQGHDVTIENRGAVGVGHPVSSGTHGVSSGTHGSGIGSGTHGISSGTHTHGHTHGTTGAGVVSGSTGTGVTGAGVSDRAYGTKEGEVIDKKYYVGKEERAQDQALIEQYREHNPYAKDYETTVQHTGRERLVGSQIEALGTRERVIGQDHQVQSHPHAEIARNLPASGAVIPGVGKDVGAMDARPGGEGWVQTKPGPVCDTNTFSITGDRIVDKERVTDLREHREFEKEFEVKTRLVGERALDAGKEVATSIKGGKGGKSPKGSPKGRVIATGDKAVEGKISGANALGGNAEILNRERVLVDEKNKNACEGHPEVGSVGGPTLASQGVGTGAGYGSGTGAGYGTGSGTGAGYGTGSGTGAGYGTGSGTGQKSTMGQKIAGVVPGSEESKDKKQGYAPGQGPEHTQGNRTAGEKVASYIPGSDENAQKKAGYSS